MDGQGFWCTKEAEAGLCGRSNRWATVAHIGGSDKKQSGNKFCSLLRTRMHLGCPFWPLSTTQSANNGNLSIGTGTRSNGRRWPSLMNCVFFYIVWMVGCVCVAYQGNTWHQDALREEGKPVEAVWWAMFCWETLGHAIHMDTLTRITFLNIVADYAHHVHGNSIPWWLWLPSAE